MTQAQLKHFYFPRWNACAKANDWRMVKGCLAAERPVISEAVGQLSVVDQLRAQVWACAEQLALQGHRAVTAEDLRHGCTIVALGRYKSSKDFENKEVDRVTTLFRLLENPDDIAAMMDWNEPERGERKRLEWVIGQAPEGYVRAICDDRFRTKNWRALETWQLRQLVVTLKQRGRAWRNKTPSTNALARGQQAPEKHQAPIPAENCPF